MPNTTTGQARKKKPKVRRREHVYTVLLMALRLVWGLTKLTLWACLGALVMFMAIVGQMTRGASN